MDVKSIEPQSTELISALAVGMNAQLVVQVWWGTSAADFTIALAAAARQTGSRLICIVPEHKALIEAQKALNQVGFHETTEFVIGDPTELLPKYKNVDFFLVDCTREDCAGLFKHLNLNPSYSVLIENNVFDRKATPSFPKNIKKKMGAKSTILPIGKGMEVTRIGNKIHDFPFETTLNDMAIAASPEIKPCNKSKWVVQLDEQTGEEHVFRVMKHRCKAGKKALECGLNRREESPLDCI
ncbi:hypothetical protein SUGI_0300260 [Cryptomeria japonica]|nr:hypothetical protein SUGI_0300260 [Cryptomeria japonica]